MENLALLSLTITLLFFIAVFRGFLIWKYKIDKIEVKIYLTRELKGGLNENLFLPPFGNCLFPPATMGNFFAGFRRNQNRSSFL